MTRPRQKVKVSDSHNARKDWVGSEAGFSLSSLQQVETLREKKLRGKAGWYSALSRLLTVSFEPTGTVRAIRGPKPSEIDELLETKLV